MWLSEGPLTWPYVTGVCDMTALGLTTAQQTMVVANAVEWMWAHSGRFYGTRAAVYRPQSRGRGVPGWPGIGLQPVGAGGTALLMMGLDEDWSVESDQTLELPGPAVSVQSVEINGVTVDPTLYRLDGRWLVRQDGQFWPRTQNMIAALGQQDTWAVHYTRGQPVSDFGVYATAMLICYFAKRVLAGLTCDLPYNTTSVSRGGVAIARDKNDAQGRASGKNSPVPAVDQWLEMVNPNNLQAQPKVWSPDTARNRRPYAGSYLGSTAPQGMSLGDIRNLADVLVLAPGGPVPPGTPIGTVIYREQQ